MTKYAFVLMPFSQEFTDIYESGIKEVALLHNVTAQRLDEQIYDNDMLNHIYQQIDKCDFLIADMTGRNPNVFYEVGYAHARQKLIILLTQNSEDIPFDLKHRPHVVYDGSIKKLKAELGSRLAWAVKEIEIRNKNPLVMKLSVVEGYIDRDENSDTAVLDFNLELLNASESRIRGLSHVYLHTGLGWTFFQDAKPLRQSQSEISPFPMRHLLSLEVSMIPQNDSVSFELTAKKIVFQNWLVDGFDKTEPRLDEHQLRGRIIVVAHTESTSFKSEIELDTLVATVDYGEELPF